MKTVKELKVGDTCILLDELGKPKTVKVERVENTNNDFYIILYSTNHSGYAYANDQSTTYGQFKAKVFTSKLAAIKELYEEATEILNEIKEIKKIEL